MNRQERRARDIQSAIRRVLLERWDPIGVADEPAAQDEYDTYVGGIYRLLAEGAPASEVASHLAKLQSEAMGLPASAESLLPVAEALRAIDVRLGEGPD